MEARSESESEDDSSSVGVEDDSPTGQGLRERLQTRRLTAGGHRATHAEAVAATVASFAMWRQLRRERRRKAETADRFAFTTKPRPKPPPEPPPHENGTSSRSCSPSLPEKALAHIFSDCPELLQPQAVVENPPPPEEEADDGHGGQPPGLPSTMEWWTAERQRQVDNPFKAGRIATVRLHFQPGARPQPPPGHYYAFGPSLRLADLPTADRNDFRRIFAKDIRALGCEPVEWEDIDVVTPIRLVRHPVTGKPRITHDSRAVNVRLVDAPAEMARAADALLRGNVAAKLDLLMAFRHVGIHEADRRVLGFVVDGYPFRWNALTFGCSQSPQLFQEALARTLRTVTLPGGATMIVYVDDLLIVAADAPALDTAMQHLCKHLAAAGWFVALDKTYPYAMAVAPFLGLLVDLTVQRLRVSKDKAAKLGKRCGILVERRKATLADLQKVGGVLAFMSAAAPEAALCRSGINAATAEAERLPGRTVVVKGRLGQDLVFWRDCAEQLPALTKPVPGGDTGTLDCATDAAGLPSLAFGGLVWPGGAPAPDIDAVLGEVEKWAADPQDGRIVGGGEVYAGPFSAATASASSSALEVRSLRAVLSRYVAKHGADALRGKVVRWFCDSEVATGAVGKWRAKADGLAAECKLLLVAVRKWGCTLRPQWVSREAGWQPIADAISKVRWHRDTPEWRMAAEQVEAACTAATKGAWSRPKVDLFATAGMQSAVQYVSRWPEVGNLWTDAFARPWNGVANAWAFPPFSAAQAALRHLCTIGRGDMDVVIIVPRVAAVPARLRDCHRVELPPMALLDVTGHRASAPCPVELDAIYARS